MGEKVWELPSAGPEKNHCIPKPAMKLPLCAIMMRLIQMHPSTRHTFTRTLRLCLMNKRVAGSVHHPPFPYLTLLAGSLSQAAHLLHHRQRHSRPLRIAVPQSSPWPVVGGRANAGQPGRQATGQCRRCESYLAQSLG